MDGPFANWTINMGPISISGVRDLDDILRYNPRCLSRDLNPTIGQLYNSLNWTTWTIDKSPNIVAFLSRLAGDAGQGHDNYAMNGIGVHGGGHLFVGGMTGSRKYHLVCLLVIRSSAHWHF
jgi:tyrosinase